ncbi:hypothetical protein N657DRAFT_412518 [Parathielavia appendiculata]|uniref:Uncharacterized protein n=1 Tax=Parathielavia appendiculata TaxID=2587402 RepID=A0AAN6Z485_9PEZI|nr:hypothetical protein N657DRAFT_412518 [Parathielavia appendiculata]
MRNLFGELTRYHFLYILYLFPFSAFCLARETFPQKTEPAISQQTMLRNSSQPTQSFLTQPNPNRKPVQKNRKQRHPCSGNHGHIIVKKVQGRYIKKKTHTEYGGGVYVEVLTVSGVTTKLRAGGSNRINNTS